VYGRAQSQAADLAEQPTSLSPAQTDPAVIDTQPKRKFGGKPEHALTWKTSAQRAARMYNWQCAVMTKFNINHRVLRIAWLLFSLFQKEGYAYATDSYISKKLGIQINHVQAALTALERAGAIARASWFVDGKPQRRIWPSTKIIPPTAGGIYSPCWGVSIPPAAGVKYPLRQGDRFNTKSTNTEKCSHFEHRSSRPTRCRAPSNTAPQFEGGKGQGLVTPHRSAEVRNWSANKLTALADSLLSKPRLKFSGLVEIGRILPRPTPLMAPTNPTLPQPRQPKRGFR
jgi:hypothetical protein